MGLGEAPKKVENGKTDKNTGKMRNFKNSRKWINKRQS